MAAFSSPSAVPLTTRAGGLHRSRHFQRSNSHDHRKQPGSIPPRRGRHPRLPRRHGRRAPASSSSTACSRARSGTADQIYYSDPDSVSDYQSNYPGHALNGFHELSGQQLEAVHLARTQCSTQHSAGDGVPSPASGLGPADQQAPLRSAAGGPAQPLVRGNSMSL